MKMYKITYAKFEKISGELPEQDYEFLLDLSAETREEANLKALEYKHIMTKKSNYEYEIMEIEERGEF